MLKRITVAMAMLLVVAVCGVVFVTVLSKNRMGEPVTEPDFVHTQSFDELVSRADEAVSEEDSSAPDEEESSTEEFSSAEYVPFEVFKAKLKTRTFENQNERITLFKNYFKTVYKEETCDVFLYDITHDGYADMIVASPIYNDEGKKVIGSMIQLFTIVEENTVREIYRDFGGFDATGGSFCCYVTQNDTGDCLLISKDDLVDGVGKLQYSVFYVLEDGTVINCLSSQYVSKEVEDYDSEQALNSYSSGLETEFKRAHTTVVDYRSPFAVTSTAEKVFGKYDE